MQNISSQLNLSSSEEDYLLAIARSEGPLKTSELARRLTVADASVTTMVAKLGSKGLVQRRSHRPISLTRLGEETAMNLLRRHRLIELFLTKTLGYRWDEVHIEAHRLEHLVSEKFIDRLDRFLGYPSMDPHGAPIPQRDGSLPIVSRTPLELLEPGQAASIAEGNDSDAELLGYLGKLGLTPGKKVTMLEREPFDGFIVLRTSNRKVTIGRSVARAIQVDEASKVELKK